MEDAMDNTGGANEASVDVFAMDLLNHIHYTIPAQDTQVKKGKILRFWVSGQEMFAKPDLYILDENQSILLILENKAYGSTARPGAQLIAQAIAAFRHNNRKRQERHLDPLPHAVIPGITFTGTTPTFFRIPVTAELLNAVQYGTFPDEVTVVQAHLPPIPAPEHEGMRELDSRLDTLSFLTLRPFDILSLFCCEYRYHL